MEPGYTGLSSAGLRVRMAYRITEERLQIRSIKLSDTDKHSLVNVVMLYPMSDKLLAVYDKAGDDGNKKLGILKRHIGAVIKSKGLIRAGILLGILGDNTREIKRAKSMTDGTGVYYRNVKDSRYKIVKSLFVQVLHQVLMDASNDMMVSRADAIIMTNEQPNGKRGE